MEESLNGRIYYTYGLENWVFCKGVISPELFHEYFLLFQPQTFGGIIIIIL